MRKTPVLITLDVHGREEITNHILSAIKELKDLGIKATFFIPASVLEENKNTIKELLEHGHQIGSHGLFHNDHNFKNGFPPEQYDKLDESDQRRFIEEATARIEKLIGRKVTCFRSPHFAISGTTVRLLQEHGYLADFSVNSQRLDLLTCDPFGFKQLLAPRLPYHPNLSNPFQKGNSKIWEIPLSCFVIPFSTMSLSTLGIKITKLFLKMLYKESKRNHKPIIYAAHPEEFSPTSRPYKVPIKYLRFTDFLPRKGAGIRIRYFLKMSDPDKIYNYNRLLLEYIKSFNDVDFVTADEYIGSWL